jgi:hypothetical protein
VFGPQRPQKTHVHSKETAPAELGVARGRSRTFGFVPAFGKVHLGFGLRRRREDLCLEGGRQHCARARGGRVEPLDFSQGGFIFVKEAIPLADPLQIHDVVEASMAKARLTPWCSASRSLLRTWSPKACRRL